MILFEWLIKAGDFVGAVVIVVTSGESGALCSITGLLCHSQYQELLVCDQALCIECY